MESLWGTSLPNFPPLRQKGEQERLDLHMEERCQTAQGLPAPQQHVGGNSGVIRHTGNCSLYNGLFYVCEFHFPFQKKMFNGEDLTLLRNWKSGKPLVGAVRASGNSQMILRKRREHQRPISNSGNKLVWALI